VLTHYHAVRVLGASAYGAEHVVASEGTLELIRERGAQDWASEVQRFPRLFQAAETVPGLTWPTITFATRMTVRLGKRVVEISHPGRGHTKGTLVRPRGAHPVQRRPRRIRRDALCG
jgi:glyoxylase-like metal-dependent hydrolase (beta-lactamase superfamily II)